MSDSGLRDAHYEHAMDMARLQEWMRLKVKTMAHWMFEGINDEVERADIHSTGTTPEKVARARELQTQLDSIVNDGYSDIGGEVTQDLVLAAKGEEAWTRQNLIDHVGVRMEPTVDLSMLRTLVDELVIDGNPMGAWWTDQSDEAKERLGRAIRESVLRGEAPAELARRIRGKPTGKRTGYKMGTGQQRYLVEFQGGILGTQTRDAQAIARTALAGVQAETQRRVYLSNPDVIKGLRQVSTLDLRTTKVCIAYDGEAWIFEASDYTDAGFPVPERLKGKPEAEPEGPKVVRSWLSDDGTVEITLEQNPDGSWTVRETPTERQLGLGAPDPREVMYVSHNGTKVEVIKNPTGTDYQDMAREVREEFPNIPRGEAKFRTTKDQYGNKYLWKATEGSHHDIEESLKEEYGLGALGQNLEPVFEQIADKVQVFEFGADEPQAAAKLYGELVQEAASHLRGKKIALSVRDALDFGAMDVFEADDFFSGMNHQEKVAHMEEMIGQGLDQPGDFGRAMNAMRDYFQGHSDNLDIPRNAFGHMKLWIEPWHHHPNTASIFQAENVGQYDSPQKLLWTSQGAFFEDVDYYDASQNMDVIPIWVPREAVEWLDAGVGRIVVDSDRVDLPLWSEIGPQGMGEIYGGWLAAMDEYKDLERALFEYKGGGHRPINEMARFGEMDLDRFMGISAAESQANPEFWPTIAQDPMALLEKERELWESAKRIEEAINRAPELPEDTLLRRIQGFSLFSGEVEFIEDLPEMIGHTVTDSGFSSTGAEITSGMRDYFVQSGEQSFVLDIKAPKGTRGAYIEPYNQGAFKPEAEFLLQAGTDFVIEDVYYDHKDKLWHVVARITEQRGLGFTDNWEPTERWTDWHDQYVFWAGSKEEEEGG